jgi:hypothetical protein
MRRAATLLAAAVLPLVLSSCFVLQSFGVTAGTLTPGAKTKAVFTLRPNSTTPDTNYQFVVVGVDDPAQLVVGKATWGTNGTFGGPAPMVAEPNLDDALMARTCGSNGVTFDEITGVTWKGFRTATAVNDKGKVGTPAVVEVVVKAKSTATTGMRDGLVGWTGTWLDDGDGIVESNGDDVYVCSGLATSSVYIAAP